MKGDSATQAKKHVGVKVQQGLRFCRVVTVYDALDVVEWRRTLEFKGALNYERMLARGLLEHVNGNTANSTSVFPGEGQQDFLTETPLQPCCTPDIPERRCRSDHGAFIGLVRSCVWKGQTLDPSRVSWLAL